MASDPVDDAMAAAAGSYAPAPPQSSDPVEDAMRAAAGGRSTVSSQPPPQTNSGWLGRQGGILARNVIEGVAGPVTGTADALIGDVRMAMHPLSSVPAPVVGPALDQALTRIGLPSPTTPTEKLVSIPEQIAGGALTGIRGGASETTAAPYAAAENAEISRIMDIHENAASRGFQIPETASPEQLSRAASTNQPLADNVVRGNFNLSPKAPLTPQMMESWRDSFNAGNSYAEARSIPKVQLNDDAVESLGSLPKPLYDRLGLDNKIATDNTLSGSDAVDISQALRARATQLWKTSKMFPEYEDQAVAVNKAVDNLEDSVAPNLKDPEQWALDRAKNAQSYNVQAALDAGHVDVRDLARMKFAKGQIKPWTGDVSDLADLGNLHPDAFQLTRTQLPNYSMLRKGLAWGAGAAASYAAGKAGLGAVSHLVGQGTSNAVAPQ